MIQTGFPAFLAYQVQALHCTPGLLPRATIIQVLGSTNTITTTTTSAIIITITTTMTIITTITTSTTTTPGIRP
jgi:hypothetical protein